MWRRLFTLKGWRHVLNDLFRQRSERRKAKHLQAGARVFHLDEDLLATLKDLALRDGRSQDEVAADLLASGLARRIEAESYEQAWETLSRREKHVAALLCLGYTTREIAAILRLSPQTVKSHTHHILNKFRITSREELRRALAHWDFSDFDR
jgi:DNA-binding CsgD family transcriptional regulator